MGVLIRDSAIRRMDPGRGILLPVVSRLGKIADEHDESSKGCSLGAGSFGLGRLALCFVPGDEMQNGIVLGVGHRRWLRFLLMVLVVLVVVVFLVWPIVSIQLRLSRNGAIAHRLVESLHARFPGITFQGAASYEREIIYITVVNHVDEASRRDVEQWLREEKNEQKIVPEIWLRFSDDSVDDNTIRM
jgi:hypothetical protein